MSKYSEEDLQEIDRVGARALLLGMIILMIGLSTLLGFPGLIIGVGLLFIGFGILGVVIAAVN